jgi:trimethylamine--corrinoid protein Co-methyltransferase
MMNDITDLGEVCEPARARRSGGRTARVAMREAPLADDVRPVRPGMPGGTYKPLTDAGIAKIHASALEALEVIGLANAPASGVEILTGAGAILGDDGRIRFPRALVEDMLAVAGRNITLHARDTRNDLHLSGSNVHFGTAGAAVHIVDPITLDYRDSTAQDLYDAARLVDNLDNIHFYQRTMVCRDVVDNVDMDLNTLYACLAGTKKHVGTSFFDPDSVAPAFDILHMVAGGEDKWLERPFVSNSNCFVVPPMKFAEESCKVMEDCIRRGMPMLLLSAGQAGATAPAPIALAIVQAMAECLAGVVYVNAIKKGAPVPRQSSGLGRSSVTCAPVPCRVGRLNRLCSRLVVRRCTGSMTCRVGLLQGSAIPNCRTCRRDGSRGSPIRWRASRA